MRGGRGEDVCERNHVVEVNVDISSVRWPQRTEGIALYLFNRCIAEGSLALGPERSWLSQLRLPLASFLQTPDISNVAIEEATFLACRPDVVLTDSSNQPVEGAALPGVLERLPLLTSTSAFGTP